MKNFTIIIPTLNEAENIQPLLRRISDVAQVFNLQPEIIFVDDGSTDGTCAKILSHGGRLQVRLLQRRGERGLSGAVIHGAKAASFSHLVIMDGDLSHQPESIPELISPLLAGKNDMVIGSRYSRDSDITGWPMSRKISSRLATLPAHFITGLEDPLSGFFSIKRDLLIQVASHQRGFKIGFEVLRLFGNTLRVAEVPIHFTDRNGGSSKMNAAVLINYILQLSSCFGIEPPRRNFLAFLFSGILAAFFDAALFFWLSEGEVNMTTSHLISFAMTSILFYFLGLQRVIAHSLDENFKPFLVTLQHTLIIALPAVFLRGGLLATAHNNSGSLHADAAILGISTLFVWTVFTSTLQAAVKGHERPRGCLVAAIIAYTLLLRFLYLGTTELIQEEAYYWNYAQHLAPGYLDHPPLVAVFIWLTTKLLGNTEIGIRLGAYLSWFITAYFSYKLTSRIYGSRGATYAVLLVAVLPIFFGAALVMTPDALLISSWAATLYFLYRALVENSRLAWLPAGIAMGIGLASKYTIILLAPAALLFLLIAPNGRRWLYSPMPYLAILLACLFFTPVIWWNLENNWASFLFQSQGRIADTHMFTTHKLLGSIILLLTPVGCIAAIYALLPFKGKTLKERAASEDISTPYLFILVMVAVPFMVFFLFSLTREVKLNWTGPIWLATVPFMAQYLYSFHHGKAKAPFSERIITAGWSKTLFSLIFMYGFGLHYLSIGMPGIPFPSNNILLGWDDLAQKVEATVDKLESSSGKRPIVVGMDKYRIASGVSFYSSKEGKDKTGQKLPAITGRHLFGLESLMFSYWHPSMLFSHQDLVVVAQGRGWLHPDYFHNRAMDVGEIQEFFVSKNNRVVSKYYYRILRGYIPSPDKNLAFGR